MNENLTLHINDAVLHNAFHYAEKTGVNLSAVVESFLRNFISTVKAEDKIKNFPISDNVRRLTGRMKADACELDLEKEKEMFLSEKYGL